MAIVANTFQTTGAKTNREHLSDVVDRITPEDTPIYSMIEKKSITSSHPEWSVDELDPPDDNAQTEGDEYNFDPTISPDRLGNYTQIFRKTGVISETQEATDDAGNVLKVKKQKLKKGIELKKDVEFSIIAPNPSVGGTTRKSGSLSTWIETNADRGATGSNGGFNQGTGLTVAPGNGTQRTFTKDLLDSVMQQGYQNGADFRHVVVSPWVKSEFVKFMSDTNVAPFRYAVSDGKNNAIVATADVYEGPFGKVMVVPNRVMAAGTSPELRARNVFLCDPGKLQWLNLRKIHEDKDVAKTGDAKKFVLIGEGCLQVVNEVGLGVIADVYGLTAST